jgi:quinoprotein glucose dehydrogenase
MNKTFVLVLISLIAICSFLPTAAEEITVSDYSPPLGEASDEAERAIKRIKVQEGYEVSLFAAEPMLANPVAFYVDYKGRFYVAETFRHHAGVSDMRGHRSWLVDDLANRTVEERYVTMERNLGDDFPGYSTEQDRVRLIVDDDGDGVADRANVFADGFSHALAGIGAGLLVDRGEVYYSCIPELWKLTDRDDDGVADTREAMSEGYGVHINFLGHDLHGLRKGPDGRIYFSIGDRGFSTKTQEGELLDYPDTGAVLRCFPDGSGLEVVHYGLRNPQELAFDQFGNLFTGDNNSDGGDQARWVYLVEGGDSGWHIGWQWITEPNRRGPWNSEKMWHPYHEGQPAHLVPPLLNYGAGPSGLTYYPGSGLPDKYNNHFFLCDFRGDPARSLIHSFSMVPKGASFEMVDDHEFMQGVLATDCEFGMDGGLYLTDWVVGWDRSARGRIYRISDDEKTDQRLVEEVKELLGGGISAKQSPDSLLMLLLHKDMRVRSEAQYALADLGAVAETHFLSALESPHQLKRLHGVWGIWQLVLKGEVTGESLIPFLRDSDSLVRGQAARVLGEAESGVGHTGLVDLLADEDARVQFFAAQALGMQQHVSEEAHAGLVRLLDNNNGEDAYIRHAGVMGLLGASSDADLNELRNHENEEVRLAALLVKRRQKSPHVAAFLKDTSTRLQLEAARAINDEKIRGGYAELAAMELPAKDSTDYEAFSRRILNARLRSGTEDSGTSLVQAALDTDQDEKTRNEAVAALTSWNNVTRLDSVTGLWDPKASHSIELIAKELSKAIPRLLMDESQEIRIESARLVGAMELRGAENALLTAFKGTTWKDDNKVEILKSLSTIDAKGLEKAVQVALKSDSGLLRLEAIAQLGKIEPDEAAILLQNVIKSGELKEKQKAFEVLGNLTGDRAEDFLLAQLSQLGKGSIDLSLEGDVLMACQESPLDRVRQAARDYFDQYEEDSVDPFLPALQGGNALNGRNIFLNDSEVSCLKCHTMGRQGGSEVGPDLTQIGKERDARYLLESIILPNTDIADGFENVIIDLKSGESFAGRVIDDTDATLTLELAGDAMTDLAPLVKSKSVVLLAEKSVPLNIPGATKLVRARFNKTNIAERFRDISSMPEDFREFLNIGELRDLVAYLSSRK